MKILTAKDNGSIPFAWSRKIYLRNGIVQIVKGKETKQRIPILEDTLLIEILLHEFDDVLDHLFSSSS